MCEQYQLPKFIVSVKESHGQLSRSVTLCVKHFLGQNGLRPDFTTTHYQPL